MSQNIVKVSKLVGYLKNKLDSDNLLKNVLVQGEISNFTKHKSGHLYFTLKDEKSRISCVMFYSFASKLTFDLKDGDNVILKASASVFEFSGQLQLYVSAIKLDGLGDLYLKFEQLKNKLYSEGLFDDNKKKKIPLFPLNIGLITGKNTAAREDVVSTIKRRWPIAKIHEYNVLVQGESATKQIIDAVNLVDNLNLDVIIIARGGGSIEDLWCFNDEYLARVIFNSKTPIISGIGHEVDFTIIDYVSDKRAPTPTGAAEIATPNIKDVIDLINNYKLRMINNINLKLNNHNNKYYNLSSSYVFKTPIKLYEQKQMKVDFLYQQLLSNKDKIIYKKSSINIYKTKLLNLLNLDINKYRNILEANRLNIKNNVISSLEYNKNKFIEKTKLLDAFSPLKILNRGYSITYLNDSVINSIKEIKIDDDMNIKLKDGNVIAKVRRINNG